MWSLGVARWYSLIAEHFNVNIDVGCLEKLQHSRDRHNTHKRLLKATYVAFKRAKRAEEEDAISM